MRITKISVISFILLALYELLGFVIFGFSPDNFFILLYGSIFLTIPLAFKSSIINNTDNVGLRFYIVLFILFLIAYGRGLAASHDYYSFKLLFVNIYGGLSILSLIYFFIGASVNGFFSIIRFLMKHLKLIGTILLLLSFLYEQVLPRVLVSVFVLILMYRYFDKKNKFMILCLSAASFIFGLGWRANLIRIVISWTILLFQFPVTYIRFFRKGLLYSFYIIPVVAFFYSIYNTSIFQLEWFGENLSEDMSSDTRTFLYQEVLIDLINNNSLWFGKGILGSYSSEFFDFAEGRIQVEVGFLKYLLQVGLVGFLVIVFLLLRASFLGFKRSKNTLSKAFSVYLSFHFGFLFIEGIPACNQYFFFVWAMVGLLLNNKFRNMSDGEIRSMLVVNKKNVRI